ncbi:MAG: DUF1573 domain-containing protein [bacterium]
MRARSRAEREARTAGARARFIPLLALLALCAGCEPDRAPQVAPPHLSFATTAYDFGRVPQGVPVEYGFTFTNDGGAPLTITQVRVACDCTAAMAAAGDVLPGGGGTVQTRCDTSAAPGPQRRTVTVYSNDPTQRAILLTLTGTVALEAAAEPARVYLGPVPPGAARLRDVALRSGSDALRFVSASSAAPQLQVNLADGADGRNLVIGTAPDAPPGPFTAVVRVLTTSPTRPMLDVPVAGIVDAGAVVKKSE